MNLKLGIFLAFATASVGAPAGAKAPTASLPMGETVREDPQGIEPAQAPSTSVPVEAGMNLRLVSDGLPLPRIQRVSSGIGMRMDPLGVSGMRFHSGIDLPSPFGTPVTSTRAGIVRFCGWAGGYGQMIELEHGNGIVTRYAHLSAILVAMGQTVEAGREIGRVGSTGHSTGNHLHYELRIAGRPVNLLRVGFPKSASPTEFGFEPWLGKFVTVTPRWTGWSDPRKTGQLPQAIIR